MDLLLLDDGRYHCPHCDYDTQLVGKVAAHLRKKHGEAWTVAGDILTSERPQPEPAAADDTPQAEAPDEI